MNSFVTDNKRSLLLVPFLYAFFSRMNGSRGFVFNAATLWVPGIIITVAVLGADGGSTVQALVSYFAGYLIFISLYEMGYLMNDTWGLRNDSTPRRRIDIDLSARFIQVFCAIRIATIVLLAWMMGFLTQPWFALILAALAATILIHNLLTREEFKLMSFLQMSLLRFCSPIFLACGGDAPFATIVIALLLFTFPRFLTYQDSKGRLTLPERKSAGFALGNHICAAPIIILTAYIETGSGFLTVWFYFLVLWSGIYLWSRRT